MSERRLGMPDVTQRLACPACGATAYRTIAKRTVFPLRESFPSGVVGLGDDIARTRHLRSCTTCGLWYFSLVPTRKTIQRILDQPGLGERWQGPHRPAFRRAHDVLARRARNGGAVLDIGSHTGRFLASLGDEWTKYALEPMVNSFSDFGGVSIFNGFLEDVDLPMMKFDCVTAFDVLEHLSCPDEAMARLARGLRPHGYLIIETGTTDSIAAKALVAGWYYINHIEHFQAFSRRSVLHLLERHKLAPIRVERVSHGDGPLAGKARRLAMTAIYSALTGAGRHPSLWRSTIRTVDASASATPPSTIDFERDHIFVVAQKK